MLIHDGLHIEPETLCGEIEEFIKGKVNELHRDGVILGLSGGIDSTVVAYLASRALGPASVLGLMLPDKHSSSDSQKHAELVADALGIDSHLEDMTPILSRFGVYKLVPAKVPGFVARGAFKHYTKEQGVPPFIENSGSRSKLAANVNAFYRIKHRMRMLILYYHAEQRNLLVAGSANKTEFLIGFLVKYGCDDAADIMPIRNLYKTQVRQMAAYLGVPKEIIDKPPSPDLIPGITDEFAIGLPYETLDQILYGLECGLTHKQITDEIKCGEEAVEHVSRLVEGTRYKKEVPYIPGFTPT